MQRKLAVLTVAAGLFFTPATRVPEVGPSPVAAYSALVEQWRPTVEAECGGNVACIDRIMWLINCESQGVDYIQSQEINPGTGMYDYGLLQISPIWGPIAYAGGAEQIRWAVPRLGTIWWAC